VPAPLETNNNDNQFDYERFVALIRTEMDRSLDPIKQSQQRMETNLAQTYTREVTNLLFQERDARLVEIEETVKGLKESVGAVWMTAVTRIGAIAGTIAAVLFLIQLVRG
jgi:hypothetical protein